MKVILKAHDSVFRFRILPFYLDKRYELIKKLVTLKAVDKTNIEASTKLLADSINSQKRFISLDPDFTIKYVE